MNRRQGLRAIRRVASTLSPRHRRWYQTLQSCTLDPADLGPQPTPPGSSDVILCGCPRSGTALLAAALFQPPTMVTVMEPWDGLRLEPAQLFASLRDETAGGSLERGRLRIDLLRTSGAVAWQRDGERAHPVDVSAETILGVKWPSYWQLLGRYPATKFLVCVRDPVEVVTSFERQGGRLAEGFDYDVPFNRSLNEGLESSFADPRRRRVALYDNVYEHALNYFDSPNVLPIRYERWHQDPAVLLDEISTFLDADLRRTMVKIRASGSRTTTSEADWIRRTSATSARLNYA